jgi:hypothetical protein
MDRQASVLVLLLACPAWSWAECVSSGDTKGARAGAKAVCEALPKAATVEVTDGSGIVSGTSIELTLPAADLTALLAKEADVKAFAKTLLSKATVPTGANFRLTVHTIGSKDRRLFVYRGGEGVTGVWDDRIHDWVSLD